MVNQEKLFDYLKKTAAELQETRKRLHRLEAGEDEPIAIVGMACRYPGGVETPEDFWELLSDGRDAVGPFPEDRGWDLGDFYDPDPEKAGKSYTRSGAFIKDASGFDAGFFGISPREALAMDPQQRLLLEVSWEALERARIDVTTLKGSKTGVFVGGFTSNYAMSLELLQGGSGELEGHMMTGNLTAVLSGRIAYLMGLEGPAVTVDTACSSSLVALHLACQAIRAGECTMALAGGVTVLVTPGMFVEFSKQQGLSVDGRCRAFSSDANGTGWAEGTGMIVLERLSDARRHGHHVLAVIRGSAINQDGASNGLTAPNGPSQQRVVRAALDSARLTPADVDAVEAHGTATTLGDPIEAQALLATYGQERDGGKPLWLGSVKSNIGHTQAAAGVAGIIKMVLALRNEKLPKTLHVTEPTPHVDWSAGEVELLTESVAWPAGERIRRAGVSSFGGSGTNAHFILEEAPAEETPDEAAEPEAPVVAGANAWLVTGRSAEGLAAQAARIRDWAAARPELDADRIAWSLATTRSVFEHRAVVLGEDPLAGLDSLVAEAPSGAVVSGVRRDDVRPVFVFPGQGSQWLGMGRELAQVSPVFAARLAECEAALGSFVDWKLSDVLAEELTTADLVQPALWAVMVSLAAVWEAAGVRPEAVVGHSQGEIAAATVAGMLSVEDGARVVALRSKSLKVLAGLGGMLSVSAAAGVVEERLGRWGDRLSLAAVNGPSAVVVSGEPEALAELKSELDAEGIRARMVAVDYASHGVQVERLEDEIRAVLAGVSPRKGRVPMVSAMSGETLTGEELDAGYWYESLRSTVHFERAIATLSGQGHQMFVEVSPHPVLLGAMNDTLEEVAREAGAGAVAGVVCATLRRDEGGADRLVASFAEAFVHGASVDWTKLLPVAAHVELPTYAFQRRRYWPQGVLSGFHGKSGNGDLSTLGLGVLGHPLLGAAVDLAGGAGLVCTGHLSPKAQPWLADHAVDGTMLLPGTGFVELAVRAGDQLGCGALDELTLQAPLIVPAEGEGLQLQVVVAEAGRDGRRPVEIFSRPEQAGPGQEWVRHAVGTVAPAGPVGSADEDLLMWPPRDATPVDVSELYPTYLADVYGPSFHALRAAWRRDGDVFAEIVLPDDVAEKAGSYGLHPVLLDAALHASVIAEAEAGVPEEPGTVPMPFAWNSVELHAAGASTLRVRLRLDGQGSVSLTAADATGAPVVSVGSLVKRRVPTGRLRPVDGALADSLFVQDWATLPDAAAPAGEWALLGTDRFGLLDGLGLPVRAYADLAELAAAVEAGEIDPSVVLRCAGAEDTGADMPETVRRVSAAHLELLHEWLAETRLAGARLVVVTQGAVGNEVTDLAGAAVWGLTRSAQSEEPDRLVLADLGAERLALLPAALGGDEPELLLRDGRAHGRRLVRPEGRLSAVEWPDGPRADPAARTLLVTGGTGTLGGLTARHLAATGRAGGVVLLSRSGASAGVAALVAELAEMGVWVRVVACDAADRAALATVLAQLPEEHPLGSVVHSAGVVDDGVISALTPERLAAVLRPKADAAWHLHELTAGMDLDLFVLYSSAAAMFGAAGQGSYVAANSFLDALAAWRRGTGLAGMSLQLGPWAHEEGIGRHLDQQLLSRIDRSFIPLSGEEGLVVLDVALGRDEPVLMPAHLDMPALRALAAGSTEVPPIWRSLVGATGRRTAVSRVADGAGEGESLRRQLASVSGAERGRVLLDLVCAHVAAVLGHASVEAIDANRAFTDVGFDSLTAVELRNRMNAATGLRLPATLIFDYPTPIALAGLLRTELSGDLPAVAPPPAPAVRRAGTDEPIAIVGMACRFPGGAASPEELWQLLAAGADAIGPFPQDRGWDLDLLNDPLLGSFDQAGGFVRDASAFDAGFFGISPREALAMDPQQRLLLEVSWEAVERAGIDPASLRGTQTGAFVGGYSSRYATDIDLETSGVAEAQLVTGNATSVLSGRLSYTLGLEGPAVTMDTACSSSLVALHLASQALRGGECGLALAGGVTVTATPGVFSAFAKAGGISVDGRCKSFAAAAEGSGFAEGAGMLVLERLSDAQRNGHPVLALIRGSAVNQDGASNGLTAPNGPSQQRVIRAALASAQLSESDVDVVEAHGSATTLGDPIEAQALLATYGQGRERPLWLGSVKSNIGHTQAAAGVAGVMKMVLALGHEQLPKTLHVDDPTPHVDWTAGEVRLLTEPVSWTQGERVRRAGVSAFGMSGTNVHVIVEEAPQTDAAEPEPDETGVPVLTGGPSALLVGGRSAEGLVAQADRLADWLAERPDLPPSDVAWSLATTRSAFEHRAVVLGDTHEELVSGLRAVPGPLSGVARAGGRTAFVFAGQGTQWAGMGRQMLADSPVFAARFAECERALSSCVDWNLTEALAGELESAEIVQPLLWAVMVSLAAVWEAAGVAPDAVVGHSQGEIAAATVAGMLTVEDAAKVVAVRSRELTGLSAQGSMVSVVMPAEPVRELVARWGDRLSIAAVNGPAAVVVSGEPGALTEFERELASRHVLRWRIPATDFVAHSPAVDSLAEVLAAGLASIVPRTGRVPMMSTVTGEWVSGAELGADYWFANLRRTVRFEDATRALLAAGYLSFVEVSPHPVLTASVTETAEDAGTGPVLTVGTLERENAGARRMLASLAEAHAGGLPVDWTAVLPAGSRVDLPTYAFQHERYWLSGSAAATPPTGAETAEEARFWAAVEGGDLAGVADTLSLPDEGHLDAVLPALASWRKRERDRSATESWRYRITWAPVAEPSAARLDGSWLVVVPAAHAEDERVRACVAALSRRGAEPVLIALDAAVTDRVAMSAVLGPVLRDTGEASGVLSLLALDETPLAGHPVVSTGLATTTALVQGLDDACVDAPLWLATCGAIAAGAGESPASPAQAQIWGFGRVVGLEYPDRWGGLVDLPAAVDKRTGAQLVAVLSGCDENQVVLRPAGILGRRLTHAPRPKSTGTWQTRGAALVTGGTGALGGYVARWLGEHGGDRLVLTSRSGPAVAGIAARAAELAEQGSQVDVLACDVSVRAEVAGVLDWIGDDLSAVVHTAAVLDDGVIDGLSPARLETALSAKGGGAAHLDELTAGRELDAFVLFSSVVATTGGPGQANYAAANAYLDALAEHRRGRGLPALSVAWGPWEAGVAQGSEAARQRLARNQWEGMMAPKLAVRALGEALEGGDTVLTVTNIDWSIILDTPHSAASLLQVPLMRDLPEIHRLAALVADAPAETAEGDLAASLTGLSGAERTRVVADLVRSMAAQVLGFGSGESVDPDRAFSEMGFDSLTSVELRNDLGSATGLRLPATLLFDYPTAGAVTDYLLAELLGALPEQTRAPVAASAAADEPIAIVGMSCRYPGGVVDPDGLWALLASGGDAISGFPLDRDWDLGALDESSYVSSGGFVEDISGFDAGFFGISPREALAMDPQQRMLLELSWEALERAGIAPESLRGTSTGVFAGGYSSGYGYDADFDGAAHLITGNATSVLSGRVSYSLGLEGPAVTVDTACSSSLMAMHLAAQALRSGECSMALAGGVTVLVSPAGFVGFSEQSGLAKDGRCKAFSDDADGMGFAEGAGLVVLEKLSDAQRQGHQVLAVLRGSAVNQDGASNGLTAPNGPSQQRVIRAALANAGLSQSDVDVVEAHGTGTKLGDPIEAQALLATYGRDRDRPLWLGSVKSNIGHTQAAAGVAGVIKMVLALRERQLPRTLHAGVPSSQVDWTAGQVELLTESTPWPANGRPRRAGVSSFGLSGTNAHVILEEAPAEAPAEVEEREPVLSAGEAGAWVLSGRTVEGLAGQAERLHDWVLDRPELSPADVAWSLATTRSVFEHRAVVTGDFPAGLRDLVAGTPSGSVVAGSARAGVRPVFVFAGQGSQWLGMGCELARSSAVFAARLAECEVALESFVDWKLSDVLEGELESADVVQPALWAVMVSLAAVWEAAGVAPDAVVGHSQGEIAAATVAGMLSLADGAKVVALRSKSLKALAGLGGMLSVNAAAGVVVERIAKWGEKLALAAVNGPAAVVVSGEPQALAELKSDMDAEGIRARMVAVDYASHCAQVESLEEEIRAVLAGVSPRRGRVPMVSAMSGETLTGEELDAGYWYESLRSTVHFERAIATLSGQGHQMFVEVTPHPVLFGAITDTVEDAAAVCGTLRRDDGGAARLLTSFAEAFVQGAPVDWAAVLPSGNRVELPTYAFERERFWPKAATGRGGDAVSLGLGAVDHPLLGAAVELAGGTGVLCTGRLSVRTHPWLADHVVGGVILLPGTGFVELAVLAGDQVGCGLLEELTLQAPLVIPAEGGVQVQVVLTDATDDGRRTVEVFSRRDGTGEEWTRHATGVLAPVAASPVADELSVWPPQGAEAIVIDGMYTAEGAYGYGPAFQTLRAAWRLDDEIYAEVRLSGDTAEEADAFGLHPALLDGVLHASALLGAAEPDEARLPFAWNGVRLRAGGASVLRARLRRDDAGALAVLAADTAGATVISVDSLVTRAVSLEQVRAAGATQPDSLFTVQWQPIAETAAKTGDWALLGTDRFGVADALPVTSFADLTALAESGTVPSVVVVCAGGADETDTAEAARRATTETLELIQHWLADDRFETARLVVLTRRGLATAPGEPVADLASAAVWGLVRSAQSENPDQVVLADFAEGRDLAALPSAVDSGEPEVAVRGGVALGRRLTRPSGDLVLPKGLWRLDPDTGGSLEGLAPVSLADAALEPGQVRVGVRVAGLNFRDVLIALGMYPGGGVMGGEVAGRILEVGPGVTGFAVGDRVLGIVSGGFGPEVIADARQLVPIPEGWTDVEAGAVPSAFLTAWYALVELAGARSGQRVLVHAAAGGVGMAAVRIARHLGLEVFATASPAKHGALAGLGLDADHISTSRGVEFERDFLVATDGRGVDIVVNSLAGELVDASLRLLPEGGSFVEMGRTDLRDPESIPAGIDYRPFTLAEAGPDGLHDMLVQIVGLMASGVLAKSPVRVWDVRRARDAFRFMSQAKHTGKMVFTIPAAAVSASRSALITGGTGTLGGLVARHLASTGRADELVLTGRSGPGAPDVAALAAELATSGASVRVVACDAAERDDLATVVRRVPLLKTVVHTAGVLDDATIASLTSERVSAVMRPKVDGAWNLHELTKDRELDEFVLFSSAASTFGAAGQGNYVAANSFLDGLAADRRAAGLPGTSLAWGLWAEASALTGQLSDSERSRINRGGIGALSAQDGLELFDRALARDESVLVPARLDVAGMRAKVRTAEDVPPLWRALVTGGPARRAAVSAGAGGADSLRQRLAGLSEQDRDRALVDLVRTHVAAVLGHGSSEAIDANRAFTDLGFDSLTAVELRNRLNTATGLRLPATLVFDYPNAVVLAGLLRDKLVPDLEAPDGAQAAEDQLRAALAAVPLARFREAGLMEGLLRLAGVEDSAAEEDAGDIDELDAESLIRLVLETDSE
ncbi:type I polyketide synthase [Amycolatopsis sp. lyj-90]|uniref:type I polyketide synthase n=1 Tax=Amycolatopsis sp. lyj-90 TaxID=2789285 RepID=UPI003979B687